MQEPENRGSSVRGLKVRMQIRAERYCDNNPGRKDYNSRKERCPDTNRMVCAVDNIDRHWVKLKSGEGGEALLSAKLIYASP